MTIAELCQPVISLILIFPWSGPLPTGLGLQTGTQSRTGNSTPNGRPRGSNSHRNREVREWGQARQRRSTELEPKGLTPSDYLGTCLTEGPISVYTRHTGPRPVPSTASMSC